MTSVTSDIFKGWTLFLDRDGVINDRLVDDYVKLWDEFIFSDGVLDALKFFSSYFGTIVVVTNQQGVGKGLMTEEELRLIHEKMLSEVHAAGGRIDRVYYCTRLGSEKPFCRKPNSGMALKAKKDFPEINFKRSVMAGDSLSDMRFGKRLRMTTALISPDNQLACKHPDLTDLWFQSLSQFADFLTNKTF